MARTELLFGAGHVGEARWKAFLAREVTPRDRRGTGNVFDGTEAARRREQRLHRAYDRRRKLGERARDGGEQTRGERVHRHVNRQRAHGAGLIFGADDTETPRPYGQ